MQSILPMFGGVANLALCFGAANAADNTAPGGTGAEQSTEGRGATNKDTTTNTPMGVKSDRGDNLENVTHVTCDAWRSLPLTALIRGKLQMKIFSFVLVGMAMILFSRSVDASPITKLEQQQCQSDYRQYCGECGLESPALRTCMDKNGKHLSRGCVEALIDAGEVSRAEVERRKKSDH